MSNILILTGYFALYAGLHSWLASLRVKDWARRTFGASVEHVYRLTYNLFAAFTFLPYVFLMTALPDQRLYVLPLPWLVLVIAIQLGVLVLAGIALLQTDILYFLGLTQLIRDEPPQTGELITKGFFRYMRHPIYTFSLIAMWITPVMTLNLFVTYALFTLYFLIGSIFEEQRLIGEFGDAYRNYQKRVPRLIPRWRKPGG